MAVTTIATTKARYTGASTGATTPAIDSTGASLIEVTVAYHAGGTPTVSDSKGNPWTALAASASAGGGQRVQKFYRIGPIVGTGHTVTVTGGAIYAAVIVRAYSCTPGDVFTAQSPASNTASSVTSFDTGSVTPLSAPALVTSGMTWDSSGSVPSATTPMTLVDGQAPVPGECYGVAVSDEVQSTATARNPNWTWAGARSPAGCTACYTVSTPPPPATATFLGTDTSTLGTWPNVYGCEGRGIANDVAAIQSPNVTVTITQGSPFTWADLVADARALYHLTLAARLASFWVHASTVKLTATGTVGTRRLNLYFLDYDHHGRSVTVNVYDNDTNALLDTRTIGTAAYDAGIWLRWEFTHNIRVEAVQIVGANIGLSGWFIGDGAAVVSPLVAQTSVSSTTTGATTPAVDTTGATLLVCSLAYDASTGGTPAISDSKSNTWVALTLRQHSTQSAQRFYYATNPTVGTGHTVTVSSGATVTKPAIVVSAFSGMDTTAPFDVESGATSGTVSGSLATGSITPSLANAVVVSALACGNAAPGTISPTGPVRLAPSTAVSYQQQTTATATNPTWNWSGGNQGAAVAIAAFKPAAVTPVRLSQVPVEVVTSGPAPVVRLSQVPVEVAMHTGATVRLSQVAVEILTPAVVPPTSPNLNPGWLAWIEWPDAPAPGLRSGAVPAIVAYSDWDLQDPPTYYRGYKQARVERFGDASRTLSEPRTGDWQGSACDFRLSDFDRMLRTMLASPSDRYWTNGNFILRMVTRPVRAALGEALTVFVGPLRRADPVPPLSMDFLLEDVVGHTMLNDEHLIPQRVIDADEWAGVEVFEATKGHPVPILYGTHVREAGAFAPIYLGVEGEQHVWMVAGHYAAVLGVFVDGVAVSDGLDWTLPGTSGPLVEEVAGRRYTLLRGRKGQPAALTDPILYGDNVGPAGTYFETWIPGYPLGGGVDPRFDVNATTDVHGGTRCITGIDLREGELVRGQFGLSGPPGFAYPRGYVIGDYDNLRLWIKNGTSFWPSGVTLEIEFLVGPPLLTPISSVVVLVHGVYGFDETNVTTWQEILIPIVDFAVDPAARADYLLIRKTGVDLITLSLDDISLVGEPVPPEVTQADAAAAGTTRLTVNVSGWTTTGDETGSVLTDIYDQYRHWLIHYVANPEGYQTGGPLANPTSDLFDRIVNVVREDSFDVASAQAIARYPPDGYLGHAIFGATPSDRLPVRQWIGRWNLSADCRFGVSRYGELFIVLHDPTTDDQDAAPVVDEVLDVLEGSFSIDVQWVAHATRIPFVASWNYATAEWTVFRDAEDTALSEAYGRPDGIPGTVREYYFIRDSDQAKNVCEHEVQRVGNPPRVLQFETALGDLVTRELGDYVTVRHFAGVGPDAERLCQIDELTIAPGTRRLRVRALDVTALIGATTPGLQAAPRRRRRRQHGA
jgi:hypothetical protein